MTQVIEPMCPCNNLCVEKASAWPSKAVKRGNTEHRKAGGRALEGFKSPRSTNLRTNVRAVPPCGIKVNDVGGSVIPANARPFSTGSNADRTPRSRRVADFSGDMGNTPARAVTVTVPGKRENSGSTPGLAFLKEAV